MAEAALAKRIRQPAAFWSNVEFSRKPSPLDGANIEHGRRPRSYSHEEPAVLLQLIQIKDRQMAIRKGPLRTAWFDMTRAASPEFVVTPSYGIADGLSDEPDDAALGLIHLPPNFRQKPSAFLVVAVLVAALGMVAPFAATPLPRFAAFIPFLNAMILVTDLITALLLLVQFSIHRSRALLMLAGGYLFTALIVIPHALTYPGAFSPTGLLGAGLQSTAWLYMFWHFGFPVALLLYAWLKNDKKRMTGSIGWSIGLTVGDNSCACMWTGIVSNWGDPFLPRLFLDATNLTQLGIYGPKFDLLICATALTLLWARRRSVLDLWLMVVACSLIGELALTVIRFSLGFYSSRMFSLATSTIVLIILLGETARLYTSLSHSNVMLQRERDNKLMNLDAIVTAISHELKQPLSTISLSASTALLCLGRTPVNVERARVALNQVIADSHRAREIFNNIRELFDATQAGRAPINVNDIALSTLNLLRDDLKKHRITTRTELMTAPRLILGHGGQLQEVFLNLIRNAIESMDTIENRPRELRIRTENYDDDAIAVTVEDTGPGIDPKQLNVIFEAFVTTKPQGTGLGLAICRMIVERHGGQLLASPSKNGGVFQIVLPIDPTAEASKRPADSGQLVEHNVSLHAG
jgi:signal transduction histidine kinase